MMHILLLNRKKLIQSLQHPINMLMLKQQKIINIQKYKKHMNLLIKKQKKISIMPPNKRKKNNISKILKLTTHLWQNLLLEKITKLRNVLNIINL